MSTITPNYAATATVAIDPQNVATSSTRVAGVESDVVDNRSNKYDDVKVSVKWRAGTSPTVNKQVDIWIYEPMTDDLSSSVTYADVLDGTKSAETFTSENVRNGSMKLLGSLVIDNTSARDYFLAPTSVAQLMGHMPARWGVFISHDTGVNSDTTAGNFAVSYQGIKYDIN